jgi:S1-C subfamily serine protease
VVASVKAGQNSVRRPWFGASLQSVTTELTEALGLDRPQGVLVASVQSFGPAFEAGIKQGDIITTLDGVVVEDIEAFGFRFATKLLGGHTKVGLRRGKSNLTVSLALAAAPETKPRDTVQLKGRWPLAGATVMTLSPAVVDELGIDGVQEGVAVAEVAANSPAANLGLVKGDVIASVDGQAVVTSKALEALSKQRQYYWPLVVVRNGERITTKVGG